MRSSWPDGNNSLLIILFLFVIDAPLVIENVNSEESVEAFQKDDEKLHEIYCER